MAVGNSTVIERRFIIDGLPNRIPASDSHLQIFDNLITGTDLKLRKTRMPRTNEYCFYLIKNEQIHDSANASNVSTVVLSKAEYDLLIGSTTSKQIRKNRYNDQTTGKNLIFDVYLGPLQGLSIVSIRFDEGDGHSFEPETSFISEITNDEFFRGKNIATLEFADIRTYFGAKKEGANDAS